MKSIVFIHGFMATPKGWDKWCAYFDKLGYQSYAPSWLYQEGSVADLQQNPHPKLASTDLSEVIAHYKNFIDTLEEKPILIGHSLGGVIVQKLIAEGKGKAGVCISSGPPKGIFAFHWDFIRSNMQLTNPFASNPLCLMSVKWFHKYVLNEMTYAEAETFVKENCVPSSRKVAQTVTKYATIPFDAPHPPLLFIAGSADRSQPPIINKKNYEAYTHKESVTTYKEFPTRTHNLINQKDWEAVADYIGTWLKENI
ncbi:MAG: alpha/beta hydrolase [Capnocytophaga sp.]|nr:alpha/beta hydrolase [Capnocytophaga sp.]